MGKRTKKAKAFKIRTVGGRTVGLIRGGFEGGVESRKGQSLK
jgi:hypothetical protein